MTTIEEMFNSCTDYRTLLDSKLKEPVYCCNDSFIDIPMPVLDRSKSKAKYPKLYEDARELADVKTTPKDKDEFDLTNMLEKLRFNTKTKLVFTIYDRSLVVNNLKLNIEIYNIFGMFLKLFDRPRALKETGRIVKEKLKPLFQKEKNDREITQERI